MHRPPRRRHVDRRHPPGARPGRDPDRHRRRVRAVHQRGAGRPGAGRRPPRAGRAGHQGRPGRRPAPTGGPGNSPGSATTAAPSTSARRSTTACAGSAPTTSTSTSCTGSTRRCRIEESWGAMAEVVAAGKARQIGLSEVTVPRSSGPRRCTRWRRCSPSCRCGPATRWPRCCRTAPQQGIAFLPFSPLGRGFLAGRFASFDDLPADDFRRGLPRFQQDALRANLAIVGRVREIADRAGATPRAGRPRLGGRPGRARHPDPRHQDPEVPGGQRAARPTCGSAPRTWPTSTRCPRREGGRY